MGSPRGRCVRIEVWWPGGGPDAQVAPALLDLVAGAELVWRERGAAPRGDVVVIPPGRAGAARASDETAETLDALRAFARGGGTVLGIDDGVALLCAAELLPGAVMATTGTDAAPTHVRIEGRATRFTWAIPAGRVVPLPEAPPAHRYGARDADVAALTARGQVVLRYCDAAGGLGDAPADGQAARVAGLCDETGRVVGVFGRLSTSTLASASARARTFGGGLVRQMVDCLLRAQP
jgi:phosphoribosylformylglycinamidine (FGAM) synthase-like amidotransferase family enzyme